MYYIIIILILAAEIFIIPFCSEMNSLLIASAPFFISIPVIIASFTLIPLIFGSILIIESIIIIILIIIQLINIIFYS